MDSVIPPEILKWAREMREVFGPGVKLRKGVKWPVPEPKRPAK